MCQNALHKSSVQSGMLQSRVWMVHVVAVLHCARLLAVMTGEADRCTLIHVGRLITSTQAVQSRNLPHTYTMYTAYTYNT